MTRSTKSLFGFFTFLAVVLMLPMTAGAVLETFNAFTPLGQDVGNYPGWFDGTDNNGCDVTAGIGIGPSPLVGIAPGQWIFTWTANEFNWNDAEFTDATFEMDFQSNGSGQFDDDRLGWMITNTSNDSTNFFGAQLDTTDGGIVTYWRNSAGDRVQTRIVALSGIKNNTWYRFTLEITKLAATQARLDVRLAELNATTGNPVPGGTVLTGTVSNSSTWAPPTGAAPAKYFTPTKMWPAYKNFNALSGAADNAFFEQSSCSGDFDKDGDVDGKDLPKIISGVEIFPLKTFAKQFGSSGCF